MISAGALRLWSIVLAAGIGASTTALTSAVSAADFGGLAICSRLTAMPAGAKLAECNRRAPLAGDCRFRLSSNGTSIEYLLGDGIVLAKRVTLNAGSAMPWGLHSGDDAQTAARKVTARTGLDTRLWNDVEDSDATYLQSSAAACRSSQTYAVYVWFSHGRATAVSVSTLPPL